MAKQGFMTVPATATTQVIFDEFVKAKEISKTAALTDMIELYMLATDEELYLNLKKKHLGVERVNDMIISKDQAITSIKDFASTYLFIKLGIAEGPNDEVYDGDDTIQLYLDDSEERGYTWFSTNSLYYGMSKQKVGYFKRYLEQDMSVKMLFAHSDWNNDIRYSAEVLDIVSEADPIKCPEKNACPSIWTDDKALIWIKIKNIQEEHELNANNLAIKSTGRLLKTVISNSQFHFGYVVKR